MALEKLRAFVAALPERVPAIAEAAAPKIQAKLRADSTTGRGNVPSFGKFGDVPTTAEARGETIVVTAADWVMDKAIELDQPEAWIGIVRETVREEIGK